MRKFHIGLNYITKDRHTHLFCLQVVHDDGKAHASVSLENDEVIQILLGKEYESKADQLTRLARHWARRERKKACSATS